MGSIERDVWAASHGHSALTLTGILDNARDGRSVSLDWHNATPSEIQPTATASEDKVAWDVVVSSSTYRHHHDTGDESCYSRMAALY